MKTYFKYIALTLLLALGLVSCEDNENWRIIPYEPEPEAPIDGPEQLYVVGAHQNWTPDAAVIGKLYPIDAMQCNGQDVSTGRAFSVRPGDVAKALDADSKEVSKAIDELKKSGKIMSPKRCYYAPAE